MFLLLLLLLLCVDMLCSLWHVPTCSSPPRYSVCPGSKAAGRFAVVEEITPHCGGSLLCRPHLLLCRNKNNDSVDLQSFKVSCSVGDSQSDTYSAREATHADCMYMH